MEERSVQIFIAYERSLSLVFWEEEWLVGGVPFYVKFLGQPAPVGAKSPIFNRYSPVPPSINTNRKSTTRFPMSLRWSWYVAPRSPKGWSQKRKTADFRLKSHFAWRKSATKLCVKTVSGKVVRHSLAILTVQKWLVESDPLYLKFWIKQTAMERNRRFSISFRS